MDVSERLSHLQRLGLHRGPARLRAVAPRPNGGGIASVVEGEWVSTPAGNCFVAQTSHAPKTERGGLALGDLLDLPSQAVAACTRDPSLERLDFRSAAFIDTETSGLAGGTGTFAFLVGIGTFRDGDFVVEQFFMDSPADERSLLWAVAATLDRCSCVVSYNGRAFDLPLLTTRFMLSRELPRLADAPHLDLLFPTRRLWRARLGSCTLGNVEREALGVRRAEADVPGWLIPTLYREYLRTGNASELRRVFYHNLQDIVSLVTLATHLGRHFVNERNPSPLLRTLPPVDQISLGRAYEELGWTMAGEEAYRSALSASLPPDQRDDAYHRLSLLLKRQGRKDEAAACWLRWSQEAPRVDHVIPQVELAKHHEWHTADLRQAVDWTERALQMVRLWPPSPRRDDTLTELQHRLNRLLHKQVSEADR
jgi:uncharacterized protein YprB with RNaseH-like and TPR domain